MMPQVLSQGSQYGTVVYARVMQSSKYVVLWFLTPQSYLNMPQYVLVSVNLPGHG